jgi:hypothetical protein
MVPALVQGEAGSLWSDLNNEMVKKLVPYAQASKWVKEYTDLAVLPLTVPSGLTVYAPGWAAVKM